MYCTYLTIYRGNKMPHFYIGRTTLGKIRRGYRGSVSSKLYKDTWKTELRENPGLFETRILSTHDDFQSCADRENALHVALKVHTNPLYINMATGYGKFNTSHRGEKDFWHGKDRSRERNPMFGRKHTTASKNAISEGLKGKTKGQKKTPEHVEAVRAALAGRNYEDLHGVEQARAIREKLKGPKSEEHKANLKAACKLAASKPRTCPHCDKDVRGASNYARWHGVNCKLYQRIDESTSGDPVHP